MLVKEQAKEEAAQINMESEVELNRVGGKPPGMGKGKVHITPGGREHPYAKGGGGTGDKPCGRCASQLGSQEQCLATGQTCFKCKGIGHLKAACRKPAAAAGADTAESDPVAASLNYIGPVSGNTKVILHPRKR